MENIATKNNIIMHLEKYIEKGAFFNTDTKKQEIYLHNLPNDETLFDIINKIRETYTIETLVFTEEIRIIDKTINYIDLSYCIFKDRIHIENCIFEEYISFEGSILEKNIFPPAIEDSLFKNIKISGLTINFQGAIFNNLKFENIEFLQIPNIQGQCTNFNSSSLCDVTFEDVKFHIPTTFEFSQLENVSFKKCTFKENIDFREILFKEKSEFLNCTFKPLTNTPDEQVLFLGSIFKGKTDFIGSNFLLKTNFSEVIFEGDTNFSETIFGQKEDTSSYEVSFNDAKFNKVARFHSCNFYSDTKFENTSFYTLVDFYLSVFHKEQQFLRTDFLDIAIFSNTTFKGETQFLYNKIESNSYINFESAKFEKGLDISRANFNCNLNFWNIFIQDDKIFEFTNYTNDFGEHKKGTVPSVYKQLRETYRIIKDNFYSQNNKIEGLKFYEKEMSVYLEEKREETNKKSPPKNKKTFIEKFREKFMEEPILSVGQLLILFFTILWTILKCPIFYIASAIFTSLIISGIIIKNKESLKYRNPIKQNYYMPVFLLVIAIILLYFYIYNIHNIKNPFYIIVTYIMLFFSMLLFYFPLEKDKIILWLNKNSNEFDTNWVVGVNFSMLVGCLTYFTILLSINSNIVFDESPEGISNFLTSLVDVFNITKWDNLEIIGVKLKDLSYLLLFIGRIFIGYGYYQTIQAFRKFGKS